MQNVKSYFSSWKPFWKSSKNSSHSQILTLAPSNINFTNSSLGDLKNSIIDENLMIDISRKLMEKRIGLCDTVVCDIIRSQDVPIGIRQTLIPVVIPQQQSLQNSRECNRDHYMLTNEEEPQSQDEAIYFTDIQAESCGCLEDDDQCDSSVITCEDSDQDGDSDDDQAEWQRNNLVSVTQIGATRFDDIELDDDGIEDCQKEMQSLL